MQRPQPERPLLITSSKLSIEPESSVPKSGSHSERDQSPVQHKFLPEPASPTSAQEDCLPSNPSLEIQSTYPQIPNPQLRIAQSEPQKEHLQPRQVLRPQNESPEPRDHQRKHRVGSSERELECHIQQSKHHVQEFDRTLPDFQRSPREIDQRQFSDDPFEREIERLLYQSQHFDRSKSSLVIRESHSDFPVSSLQLALPQIRQSPIRSFEHLVQEPSCVPPVFQIDQPSGERFSDLAGVAVRRSSSLECVAHVALRSSCQNLQEDFDDRFE